MAARHRGPGTATGVRGSLTGVTRLTRVGLRTGWPGLLAVVLVAAGLVTAVAGSIGSLYPELVDRQQYAATVGASPASQAFNGLGFGLSTTGGIAAYEIGFMGQLLFPVLALHVSLRHTRREEEAGRTELLTAARVGRLAPLGSGVALLSVTALATGALVLAGMVTVGLPAAGSAWYAAGVSLLMLFFGAAGLLLGQLTQSARTAYLVGLAVVTAAFLARAVVDGYGWEASWVSPLGWAVQVRPFADPQGWPLLAYAGGSLLLIALAVAVARRRDLGAGIIPPRPGPARGARSLGTVTGAAWRLTRPAVLSWAVLAVIWAACFGILSREMGTLVDANPTLLEALGVDRGSDVVTGMAVVVIGLAATAVAVQGFGRLGSEESADRLGAVLATRVPRMRFWLLWWAVVALSSLAVLAAGMLALGLSTWASTGDRAALTTALGVGVGYAVPVLFVSAVAGLLRGALPRVAPAAWVLVGWIVLVGFLAETLRIPGWARDLSPLHLVGTLPQEDPSLVATVALAAGGAILLALSTAAFRRRDLRTG